MDFEEEVLSSEEDKIDLKGILENLSFKPLSSSQQTEERERADSPGKMLVSDTEEDADGQEDKKSLSELSSSLSASSADTVLLSQNQNSNSHSDSQPSLEVEEPSCQETPPVQEDTQIKDKVQSGPSSSDQIPRDQNSNAKENSGAFYWPNEFLKSGTKPKKLDIEDISFPATSSLSQRDEEGEPGASSSKEGKRRRSSSPKEENSTTSSSSSITATSSGSSRSKRAKGKKEQPQGTCPICERSMKMRVLVRHAGK